MKFQLPRIAIISIIAALGFPGAAHAADVGRVLLAAGDTVALRGSETIKLTFGSPVQDKDVLRTGPASSLQVRFVDESIVSMKEASELRIDEFQFSGKEDGTERAFFRLVKGGLRTVTGLIGRANNKSYQMSTTTASIGIRGTDYSATLCQGDCRNSDGSLAKDGLYGRTHGISHGTNRIDVSNAADSKTFGVNENFYVATAKSLVERLLVSPDFVSGRLESRKQSGTKSDTGGTGGTGTEQATTGGAAAESRPSNTPEPLPQLTFVATQDLNPQGTAAVLAPANGFVVVYPLNGSTGAILFDDDQLLPSATFNALNHLTSYGSLGTFPSGSLSGGTITDTGSLTLSNGQTFAWGRWTGPTLVTISGGSTLSNVPLLFGTATGLENELTGLFGGVATYTYAGGPKPVDAGGNVGSITSTSATINFTLQTAQLSLAMNFPSVGAFGPASFTVSGSGTKSQSSFGGDFVGSLSGSCVGSGCFSPAAGGFFDGGTTGPNGYDFSVFGGVVNGTKAGEVAFLNAYLVNTFTPGALPATSKAIQFTFTDSPSTLGTGSQGPTPSFTLSPPLLTSFSFLSPSGTQSGSLNTGTVVESTPLASPAVQANALAAGNIQWGRWTGSFTVTNGPNPPQTPGSGLHYIYGDISGNLPTTGSAIFSYIGGTNPTNSSGQVGTFTGGAFNVNFVNQAITISTPLTFTMPGGLSYNMNACTTCAYGGPQAGFIVPGSTLTGMCTGGSCSTGFPATGQLNGGLTGVGGTGLMTTSAINTAAPGVPITTFAAAFKR